MKKILLLPLLASLGGWLCPNLNAGDTVHSRGWIGGEYSLAKYSRFFESSRVVPGFPAELGPEQKEGVFVRSVPSESPAAMAGLEPGDLILRVDGRKSRRLRDFYRAVNQAQPGQPLELAVWRQGQSRTLRVAVGRETYRHVGTFGLGIHLSGKVDLWPNPDFSLLALGFNRHEERLELHSPESEYLREVRRCDGEDKADVGRGSPEGWNAWLAVIHLGMHKRVMSQERVEPGA